MCAFRRDEASPAAVPASEGCHGAGGHAARRRGRQAQRSGARGGGTVAAVLVAALALGAGCSPSIGDECGSSVNCDINGTRICDTTSPGGYCTIRGCDTGTCPADEAVCVAFFPETPRLTDTFCMALCKRNADCRDGYACVRGSDVGARVLDGDGKKFCAVPPPPPTAE